MSWLKRGGSCFFKFWARLRFALCARGIKGTGAWVLAPRGRQNCGFFKCSFERLRNAQLLVQEKVKNIKNWECYMCGVFLQKRLKSIWNSLKMILAKTSFWVGGDCTWYFLQNSRVTLEWLCLIKLWFMIALINLNLSDPTAKM